MLTFGILSFEARLSSSAACGQWQSKCKAQNLSRDT